MRNPCKLLGDEWLLSTQLSSDLVLMLAAFIWLRLNASFNYSVILATCSYSGSRFLESCVLCVHRLLWSLASQASGICSLYCLNSFFVIFFTLRSCFEICNETAFSSYSPSSSFMVALQFSGWTTNIVDIVLAHHFGHVSTQQVLMFPTEL